MQFALGPNGEPSVKPYGDAEYRPITYDDPRHSETV